MKRCFWPVLLYLSCIQLNAYSQQQLPVAALTEKKTFTFIPEMVYPMSMRPRQATSGFMLRVSQDSLICYLPYFGQATGVDYGSGKSSTDFTTAKFDYITSKGKKGATIVTIRPQDNREVRAINITYYSGSDYANVVISFNRQQSISYRGRITGTGQKE